MKSWIGWTSGLWLVGFTAAVPASVDAQDAKVVRPVAMLGFVFHKPPDARDGFPLAVAVPVPVRWAIWVAPAIEFARMNKGLCELNDTLCNAMPDPESLLSMGAVVGLGASVAPHPFIQAGPTAVHSSRRGVDSDRRTFLAPKVEAGLRPRGPGGRWWIFLRWRQFDRSSVRSPGREYGLFLGFQPGGS